MLYHIYTSHEVHTNDGHILVLSYKACDCKTLHEANKVYIEWIMDRMIQAGNIGAENGIHTDPCDSASWKAVKGNVEYDVVMYRCEERA